MSDRKIFKFCVRIEYLNDISKSRFVVKLKSVGFKVQQYDINYFGEENLKKMCSL